MRATAAFFLCLAALIAPAGSASADSAPVRREIGQIVTGYTYYNRPGATLADHNADLKACTADTYMDISGVYKQGLATALIWSGPVMGMVAIKVENCMIVRGWRVVKLDDKTGAELAALSDADLAARMAPLVGAAAPPGQIMRHWENEAFSPATYHLASRAAHPGKGQLSLRLLPPPAAAAPAAPDPAAGATAALVLDPKWPVNRIKPEEMPNMPPEAGFIILRVMGVSNGYGTGIGFARADTAPDSSPRFIGAGIGILFAKNEGNWFVVAVHPGRWRIASSGFLMYCLGSPSFQVEAGEVVYAGTFDLKGMQLGPDLDMVPAKAFLAAPYADRARPAVYRNGAVGDCHYPSVVYALEFPGAPFDPDYHWGSAYRP